MQSLLIPKIIFGRNNYLCAAEEAAFFGSSILLAAAPSFTRTPYFDNLISEFRKSGVSADIWTFSGSEPTPESVMQAAAAACEKDAVVAVGGGSIMDIGKAAAAMAVNEGSVEDYIEGVGTKKLAKTPLPFIALPTTSGTGSEMTKNSPILREGSYKNSMRDDRMLARTAIVDPMLTLSLPASVTASSGADAVCQLIESYTTRSANITTDGISIAYISDAVAALPRAVKDGSDIDARESLSLAASASGICLANSGLGLAHGIAAGLGAICGVKHGIACGILMPKVAMFNAKKGVHKYIEVALRLGKAYTDAIDAGKYVAEVLENMNDAIGLPADLKGFNIDASARERIISLTANSSSAKKNPVDFNAGDVSDILASLGV